MTLVASLAAVFFGQFDPIALDQIGVEIAAEFRAFKLGVFGMSSRLTEIRFGAHFVLPPSYPPRPSR
jgi:hypothetical protein